MKKARQFALASLFFISLFPACSKERLIFDLEKKENLIRINIIEWPVEELEKNLQRGYKSQLKIQMRLVRNRSFFHINDNQTLVEDNYLFLQDPLSGNYLISQTGMTDHFYPDLPSAIHSFRTRNIILQKNFMQEGFLEVRIILEPLVLKPPLNLLSLFINNQKRSDWVRCCSSEIFP